MSEQDKVSEETSEQKHNRLQVDKSIKSLVGSLRKGNTEKPKPNKEPKTPIRKRKRLQ
jgi:hypothetical protein